MGRRLIRSVRMTDITIALVRSRHSLYMFVSATEHVLQCEFGIGMTRPLALASNMAEFQEGAVVCPCTDEKQFRDLELFSGVPACKYELRDVE